MSQRDVEAAIAVTRFGLGARPGELDAALRDPRQWLLAQVRPEGGDQPDGDFLPSRQSLAEFYEIAETRRAARTAPETAPATPAEMSPMTAEAARDPGQEAQRALRLRMQEEFAAHARLAALTSAPFRERWALFWANHFTVSAVKLVVATVAGAFQREAIRPHVFGRFEQMLLASTRHPAMLTYLDQAQSIGPNSRAGARRGAGLNENLAREILELHTIGADAGYSQGDVTEFARALTGWTVGGRRAAEAERGLTLFRVVAHEPGARTVLGRRYEDAGEAQALAILRDLAADPRTARRLSRKLAAHFVADQPPAALAQRLERTWLATGGDLAAVARTLVEAPEAWTPEARKLKTPYEFVISSYRVAGQAPREARQLQAVLLGLGQRPFAPPSPEGWPDDAASWAAPDALLKRLQFAEAFAARAAPPEPPGDVARRALGARLSAATEQAVRRAESRSEAFTLLLMSPEHQRR